MSWSVVGYLLVARWVARVAALDANSGQLAVAHDVQELTEVEGQAVLLTAWTWGGHHGKGHQ